MILIVKLYLLFECSGNDDAKMEKALSQMRQGLKVLLCVKSIQRLQPPTTFLRSKSATTKSMC